MTKFTKTLEIVHGEGLHQNIQQFLEVLQRSLLWYHTAGTCIPGVLLQRPEKSIHENNGIYLLLLYYRMNLSGVIIIVYHFQNHRLRLDGYIRDFQVKSYKKLVFAKIGSPFLQPIQRMTTNYLFFFSYFHFRWTWLFCSVCAWI